jgi:deoxyadenosine/deoxycytidine kinase/NTP pyrophosphatase (non-canonical NTP hydrolase)
LARTEQPWYIVIEGAIGVGKTTLARLLSSHYATALMLEVFEENPFLADFYADRGRYAFQTQMFFLLSRYRQQQQLARARNGHGLFADYMFAKDWLFAQLNLSGDEWKVYEQIHNALAEQIHPPDLIVYLQADTDVLMGRIAQRDRTYERDMDRDYIDALRQAYEAYFQTDQAVPILTINTNDLNYVTRQHDLRIIIDRINSALQEGTYQKPLPKFEVPGPETKEAEKRRILADYQRFHIELDQAKGFNTDIYFNYLCLSEEMGELGSELAKLWRTQDAWVARGNKAKQALARALEEQKAGVETELADCLAYLLKLANYVGVDLEQAYLQKMDENMSRDWGM